MMRVLRAIGLAAGIAVFAAALHSWAIASTGAALGTDLGVAAVAPGELAVSSGLALQASGLQPGMRPANGTLHLRNITGVPVRLRVRALPSTRVLDDVLELRASAGGRSIALGRAWQALPGTLGVRERADLPLRARLRRPAQGLIADVALELDAIPVRVR